MTMEDLIRRVRYCSRMYVCDISCEQLTCEGLHRSVTLLCRNCAVAMYLLRETTQRKRRKLTEEGSHDEANLKKDEKSDDQEEDLHTCPSVSLESAHEVDCYLKYLRLYFRCRCDDKEAWQELQSAAENDMIAKVFVCDVLMHNDSCQEIRKDVQRAQELSKDIHHWIASTEDHEDEFPTMHVLKLYISGIFYSRGIGGPRSRERAKECLTEAASMGNCLAQYFMGVWHEHDSKTSSSHSMETAVSYFRMSAVKGHPVAQNMLGLCYATGRGVPVNDTLASEQYELAAQQGLSIAQSNLQTIRERQSQC